jgi:hypothetical protein
MTFNLNAKLNKKTNNATKIVLKSPSFKFSCCIGNIVLEDITHLGGVGDIAVHKYEGSCYAYGGWQTRRITWIGRASC